MKEVKMVREIILPDGNRFIGEFENGMRNGKGLKTYRNGGTYEGIWKDDVRHGKGVKTQADGTQTKVEYVNGRKV